MREESTDIWHEAMPSAALTDNGRNAVRLAGWSVLVCRVDGVAQAVVDRCPHAGSPLRDGRLRAGTIQCPLHGARFDIRTGHCIGAAYAPLRLLAVEERDGMIRVAVPGRLPSAQDMPIQPV